MERASAIRMKIIDKHLVAEAHDAMLDEYDDINDLWYTHLFNVIHEFIARKIPSGRGKKALDVGCGTGFQSLLLARAGYEVHGFDIAAQLVELAKSKATTLSQDDNTLWPLYRTSLASFMREQVRIVALADQLRNEAPVIPPKFWVDDAMNPKAYNSGPYDCIVCCGSVLSFINDHERMMAFIGGALKRGGLLFLEVEQKVNMDLLWPIVDSLLLGKLHYEQSFKESLKNLFVPPGRNLCVEYPFKLTNGKEVILPLWLFSVSYLGSMFKHCGLQLGNRRGIHILTNIFPSTILHKQYPTLMSRLLFTILARADGAISGFWPFWRLGEQR